MMKRTKYPVYLLFSALCLCVVLFLRIHYAQEALMTAKRAVNFSWDNVKEIQREDENVLHPDPEPDKTSAVSDFENVPSSNTCKATFGKDSIEDKEKILSYRFPPEALQYLRRFKCLSSNSKYVQHCHSDENNTAVMPVIGTGASANHYNESLSMLRILNDGVRKKHPGIKLVFFDFGLEVEQKRKIKRVCGCDFQPFPFEQFPEHVRYLRGYAWKPIAIQLLLDRSRFVIWMDSSIDMHNVDISLAMKKAKTRGILFGKGRPDRDKFGSIARRTGKFLFNFLGEEPCLFARTHEGRAGFLVVYWSRNSSRYIMEPWLSCALSINCMVPSHVNSSYHLGCETRTQIDYHLCHRFDQSVLMIILTRLYHHNFRDSFIRNAGITYSIRRRSR